MLQVRSTLLGLLLLFAFVLTPSSFAGAADETSPATASPVEAVVPPIQQAIAVLKCFETGDPTAILAYVTSNHFLQHNLGIGDGRDGWVEALPAYKKAGAAVRTVRAFVDGDYVVTHSEYRLSGKTFAGFDVFRFADGPLGRKIVEHWDNLQEQTSPNPGGHKLLDGESEVTDLGRTEANKSLVMSLLTDVYMSGNFDARLTRYFSADSLIQHSPGIADGIEGLRDAAPMLSKLWYRSIEKLLGQGNFVLALSNIRTDGKDLAVYDLFRLAGGKVVEHWSTVDPIPPTKEWKNTRGKF